VDNPPADPNVSEPSGRSYATGGEKLMEKLTERWIAHLFGLIGGALVIVGGLVTAAFGFGSLLLGHAFGGLATLGEAIVLVVVGGLILLFAYLGEHEWSARPVASGVLLVLLALIAWAVLGLGPSILALLGGIFALLAGALYLIEPTERAARMLASPG